MDLLCATVGAAIVLLLLIAPSGIRRRRKVRVESVLVDVEAASPLVIADWPSTHISGHLDLLTRERLKRSASYRHGLHTVTSREREYLVLQRIGRAEDRLREAREMASGSPRKTVHIR